MKEIDQSSATEVNGGLNPRQFEDLPYSEPLPVKGPLIQVDYNPLPLPQ
jgi:hypothetical protein